MPLVLSEKADSLPLLSRTPHAWGHAALSDPIALLIDHAFLEKKAALNAMELMTRWPGEWVPGWVEIMTRIARDEAAHLVQVVKILVSRGGHLGRLHKCQYATDLRELVRKGETGDTLDRLLVSALIEARSCERFSVLAEVAQEKNDPELAAFYKALFSSEHGHYKVFLRLGYKTMDKAAVDRRWNQLLVAEAKVLANQVPGPRIHSGYAQS